MAEQATVKAGKEQASPIPDPAAGWLPALAMPQPRGAVGVTWLHMPETALTLPNFGQVIDRARAAGAEACETDAAALPGTEPRQPAGFIFHLARCGSTLLAGLLNRSGQAACFAEPAALGELLGHVAWAVQPDALRIDMLRRLMAAFGAWAPVAGKPFAVKFASLGLIGLPLLHAAFPAVPRVFVYRDPLEVMVSQLSKPPVWLRPDTDPFQASLLAGIAASRLRGMPVEEYLARVMARLMGIVLQEVEGAEASGWLLVNYTELPDALHSRIAPHFRLALDDAAWRRVQEAARIDAKDPAGQRVFVPDAAAKRRVASAAIHRAVEEHLAEPYQRLEQARLAQYRGP